MSVIALRTAIVDELKTKLASAVKTVEGHGGRFDAKELMRVSAKAPAVFVAAMLLSEITRRHSETTATISWAVFVVAKDQPNNVTRDVVALTIAEAIGKIVPDNRWGLDGQCEGTPTSIRAQNMFSAEIDAKGVAMWGLSWQQKMVIAAGDDTSTLDDLLAILTATDLDPSQDDEPLAHDQLNLEAP